MLTLGQMNVLGTVSQVAITSLVLFALHEAAQSTAEALGVSTLADFVGIVLLVAFRPACSRTVRSFARDCLSRFC